MRHFVALSLAISCVIGLTDFVRAQNPPPPPELVDTIQKIDAAASSKQLQKVMEFYNPNFENNDGLRFSSLEKSLSKLWATYASLNYKTEIVSWEKKGEQLTAQTITRIQGTQKKDGRDFSINSTIRSEQVFEGNKLVSQQILSEETQVNSGANPPNVRVILPESVRIGQQYEFDVIVEEPLGDEVLLGKAMDERIRSDFYLKPSEVELEVLAAGGIFKLVKAPLVAENRWLSAVLVRSDGMTIITRRVKVVEK